MKKLIVIFIVIILLVTTLTAAGCSPKEPYELDEKDLDMQKSVFEDLPYGGFPKQRLDVILPKPLGEMSEAVPAFVYIHGGSWSGGDKSGVSAIDIPEGYAVLSINYRLLGDGAIYTDMLDDITGALNFIKKNGKLFKIRTDKVALWGYSAGGHLALLYGYRNRHTAPITPSLLVSQAGPTDFADPSFYQTDESTLSYRLELVSSLIGAQVALHNIENNTLPHQLSDASPITFAIANYVPTVILHGEKDTVVPYTNSSRLYEQLTGYGHPIRAEFIGFPNSGHDLADDPDKTVEAKGIIVRSAESYLLPVK